jgi:NAD-dependent dihydropyrimidine dehydrogenase PreA subunit
MSHKQTVWVDAERCTGCGACVEICPVEAVALRDDKAWVDDEACTGCLACVDACPQDAVRPLVHGELVDEIVPAEERPVPAVQRAKPLAETAGVAIAAAGVGVLAKAAGALVRAVGRWLAQGLDQRLVEPQSGQASTMRSLQRSRPFSLSTEADGNSGPAQSAPRASGGGRAGRGRQTRRRHRGG